MCYMSRLLTMVALLGAGPAMLIGCQSSERDVEMGAGGQTGVEVNRDTRDIEVEVEDDGDVEVEREGAMERGLEKAGEGVGKGIEKAGEGMNRAGEWVQEKVSD